MGFKCYDVEIKFYLKTNFQNFFAMAYTTLKMESEARQWRSNILAVGGTILITCSFLRFFPPFLILRLGVFYAIFADYYY